MSGRPADAREQAAYDRLLRSVERVAASVDPEVEDSFAMAVHQLMERWRRRGRADRRRLLAIMASCTIGHFVTNREHRRRASKRRR